MKKILRRRKILALCAITASFIVGYFAGTFNIFYKPLAIAFGDSTNYLIITQESWTTDSTIQQFVQWKTSKGYSVKIASVSEIVTMYPVPSKPTNLLKAKDIISVADIDYRMANSVFYYSLNGVYGLYGYVQYFDPVSYIDIGSSSSATEILLYTDGYTSPFTIRYINENNQDITTTVRTFPLFEGKWGLPAISLDGNIEFIQTQADSVMNYIRSFLSMKYVLLIGRTTVPSYECRHFGANAEMREYSWTDAPYSAETFDNNNNLYLERYCVGRIPTDDINQMHSALTKAMNYVPFESNKMFYLMGDPLGGIGWETMFNTIKDSSYSTILGLNSAETNYELRMPSLSTTITNFNVEKDFVVIWAHGNTNLIALKGTGEYMYSSAFSSVTFQKSTIAFVMSCMVGNYKDSSSYTMTMFNDFDSKTVAVVSSSLSCYVETSLCTKFFAGISIYGKVGDALVYAKMNIYSDYTRVCFNLFGDPSLMVVDKTQPVTTGTLFLDFTINNTEQLTTENVTFMSYAPDGIGLSVQTHIAHDWTIYNMPYGNYFVHCFYEYKGTQYAIRDIPATVVAGEKTSVTFNFIVYDNPIPPPEGDVVIISSMPEVEQGTTVTFNSAVTNIQAPYTYTWYKNTQSISGAFSNTYQETMNTVGTYIYYLVVNGEKSNEIVITVNPRKQCTITITSNTDCTVDVYFGGQYLYNKAPTFIITAVTGIYDFTAKKEGCPDQTWSVITTAFGDSVSHNFVYESSNPPNASGLPWDWIVLGAIFVLVVIFVES